MADETIQEREERLLAQVPGRCVMVEQPEAVDGEPVDDEPDEGLPVLSRDEVLAFEDANAKKIHPPGWPGAVYVRALTEDETTKYYASITNPRTGEVRANVNDQRARFAALVLSDKNGKRLCEDSDVGVLSRKSFVSLDHIFNAGMDFNGFGDDAAKKLEKNSG